ncbi:SDR family oxidoreductase [Patescibacteria group bacterium]|nr:SDR family oxidoreductase [Patescibacteria group bacterium]
MALESKDETMLIIGAGGYIGTHLVRKALDKGYKIKALDRFFFGKDKLDKSAKHPELKIIDQDIRSVTAETFQDVDIVVSLAGISNDPACDLDPELTRSINYEGIVHSAKTAKEAGVPKYVEMSSCSVYGSSDKVCDEESPRKPVSLYAEMKTRVEDDIFALADKNFALTAFRNSTAFGISDRMRFDLVVNIMSLCAQHDGYIRVFGTGEQWRPFIHVEDIADATLHILNQDPSLWSGEVFNLGACTMDVNAIAKTVREALNEIGVPIQIQYVPEDVDPRNYAVSFEKFLDRFTFRPRHKIEDTVKDIFTGLANGNIREDPTCYTVKFYQSLIEKYGSSLLLS